MTNQSQVTKQQDKFPIKTFFEMPVIKKKIEELVSKNASSFTTSVLQIVNSNSLLKNADPMTVFNAACMAATLQLPLQNGLGFAYIVPYKNNKTGKYDAQFQLGYKGLIQLAQRSGQFKRLVAVPVYEKQLITEDPINGFEFDWKQKPEVGELPIGYYAYFRLLNDFTAELYMTQQEVNEHAKRYSQTYRTYLQKKEKGQWASSVWADNFEAMALKTVMKLLLSKQAPLSVEMQQAVLADQAVVKDVEKAEYSYPDNEIQDAEFTDLKVTDEQFEKCKQNIVNKETTLQDLCDNGFEFSREQYAELEKLENE
ncbi:recombinase [Histophilus somni]|uniref:recombinase RecT n=1 Tax=Histophilus somni TaxID=731 RepID=UPI000B3B532B|nr:recombinase RecT [Histophilus somni]ARU66134.1 recombinase [Histophilus somni]ARU68008.1 recombinase [Histophilus somni]ARU69888.1 recombinase [Histophilus somni]ARU71763.1 recombinase [Histophilus somni]ARU76551.1 recombinase [Histophilus somni]